MPVDALCTLSIEFTLANIAVVLKEGLEKTAQMSEEMSEEMSE